MGIFLYFLIFSFYLCSYLLRVYQYTVVISIPPRMQFSRLRSPRDKSSRDQRPETAEYRIPPYTVISRIFRPVVSSTVAASYHIFSAAPVLKSLRPHTPLIPGSKGIRIRIPSKHFNQDTKSTNPRHISHLTTIRQLYHSSTSIGLSDLVMSELALSISTPAMACTPMT